VSFGLGGCGAIRFDLQAEAPGTANLQLRVNYETELGCPGATYYQFLTQESATYPLRVREP
jgi:hypothetical protein